MKDLKLEKQQKTDMVLALRHYLTQELDVEIGALQVEILVDHLAEVIGPVFYNKGLRDAHEAVLQRMEYAAADIDLLERSIPRR
ncbi:MULTISPECIES: DUF2164 family protein [Rhizobium/Agrobacterium group]|uniref:DUF2164 domain-containing protein n=1 Tax=Rhizobium/Agrobacterium group TaxID=227290 RepID=UPI000714E06B|nr:MULTISPECIES: DUF2164 family protein [Rhizobium/Agrobacterium group]KQQ61505.1 hypothetical protein ASF69_03745 [Rhizobium sp. Leaf311]